MVNIELLENNINENLKMAQNIDEPTRIRMICLALRDLEKSNYDNPDLVPVDSYILLAVEVPGSVKDRARFITLEKSEKIKYLVGVWGASITENGKPMNISEWKIEEDSAEKVLTFFLNKVKLFIGGNNE